MKRKTRCNWLGHKWLPVYIKGTYNGVTIKFIACYCQRCFRGYDEVHNLNNAAYDRRYGTYSERFFDEA